MRRFRKGLALISFSILLLASLLGIIGLSLISKSQSNFYAEIELNKEVFGCNENVQLTVWLFENNTPLDQTLNLKVIKANQTFFEVNVSSNTLYSFPLDLENGNYQIVATLPNLTLEKNFTYNCTPLTYLSLKTDKHVYWENESIRIEGKVVLNSTPYTGNLSLIVSNGEKFETEIFATNGSFEKEVKLKPGNYSITLRIQEIENSTKVEVKKILPRVSYLSISTKKVYGLDEQVILKGEIKIDGKPYDGYFNLSLFKNEELIVNTSLKAYAGKFEYNLLTLEAGKYLVKINVLNLTNQTSFEVKNLKNYSVIYGEIENLPVKKNEAIVLVQKIFVNVSQPTKIKLKLESLKNLERIETDLEEYSIYSNQTLEFFANQSLNFSVFYFIKPLEIEDRVIEKEWEKERIIKIKNPTNLELKNLNLSFELNESYESISFPSHAKLEWKAKKLNVFLKILKDSITLVLKKRLGSKKTIESEIGKISVESNRGNLTQVEFLKDKLKIKIEDLRKGERVKVAIQLPFSLPPNYVFYIWKNVSNQFVPLTYNLTRNRSRIEFYLEDGKLDEDGRKDGKIVMYKYSHPKNSPYGNPWDFIM